MSRVMVVDDDSEICNLIQDFLEHEGYTVSSYEDAHFAFLHIEGEALKGKKKEVDLIISDVKMPIMDGLEFIKKLQQIGIQVPVIMISGFGVHHSLVQHNEPIEFLHKPFSLLELKSSVHRVLNKK